MLKLHAAQPFFGYHYRGRTFDCGSPEGFVEANVAFALARTDMNESMGSMIRTLLDEVKPSVRRASVA